MESSKLNQAGAAKGNYATYIVGFALSVILTLVAFYLVYQHKHSASPIFSHKYLMGALVVLAIVQLFVQLLFFLHLDRESKPFWNLQIAIMAAGIVLILVVGSIWIMNNLNYHMLTSQQMEHYVQSQDGGGF